MPRLQVLDKTEPYGGKIDSMRLALPLVSVCVWLAPHAHALAQAEHGSKPAELGAGGAYLFGFALGLVIFGLRQAVAARKAHLAGLKK